MSYTNHYIKKCSKCEVVISQCRCPGPKAEKWGVCASCYNKRLVRQEVEVRDCDAKGDILEEAKALPETVVGTDRQCRHIIKVPLTIWRYMKEEIERLRAERKLLRQAAGLDVAANKNE